MIKVGIIGCGNIGGELAAYVCSSLSDSMELVRVFDIDKDAERGLREKLGVGHAAKNVEDLIRDVDLVVETASTSCVVEIFPLVVKHKRDIVIISPGGIIHHPEFLDHAEKAGVRVFIPSGAIAGIDALRAASLSGISSVVLTTRKPPRGLDGAPYIVENNIDLSKIAVETTVFEGTVAEAVEAFPKNINVSAILSLAGIGSERTRVRIVTAPTYTSNTHEIAIEGEFGSINIRCDNKPCQTNPKTSFLSILSAKALLKGMVSSFRVGT